jgi:succinoglycan biosynthesis transport protein ExoP
VPTIEQPQSDSVIGPELPATASLGAQIDLVTGFLRRRYRLILLGLLLALPFGAVYLYITPASYTASSIMMIEPRKGPLDPLMGSSVPDAVWIESQSIALRSLNVASYVVKQLRLADDSQFVRAGVGWLDKVLFRLGWGEDPEPRTEPERVGAAIAALNNGLFIKRLGASYMMQIDFRSENKEQAAKIANTMIDAYIFDQLNAKYQANRRASDWLQERLQALREQAAAAERAAIEYRAKNNIVATGGGGLMNEKELTEMSSGLVNARVHASDVQARLERLRAVRKAYQQERPNPGEQDETVPEAMASGIITPLRAKYLDLVNRESDWSLRYGKNHTAVVNLRNQIRDIRRSIGDELGRIEENLKSEYEIAKKREEEFDKSQAKLISQSTETNQALVTYFSLDAAAKSYRRLYDNFLQRHTESVQQQTFPVSEARQISSAAVYKTGPKTSLIAMATLLAGAVIGGGLAAFREIMDRRFRTREQVQSVLATECLAMVPLLADNSKKRVFSKRRPLALEQRREKRFDINGGVGERSICSTPRIMETIINAPGCEYAEAIRAIKLTIDMNNQANAKIIGLTSSLPSEGKSTLAVAMATLIAQSGARVILVDCDVRHSSISRLLAPDANTGLLDVIGGTVDLADAVWTDEATQLEFLPVGESVANATEFLASRAAKSLFDTLQIKYDYVIVDLAPLVASMDVRATSGFIDSYLLVVAWGSTKIDAVQYALRHAPGVHANMVGVVLNKVDMAVMGRYDSYGANYYYGQPQPQPRRASSVN